MEEDGTLWIAKFPSRNDDVNIGAWEMVVHELALLAGIHVPEARHITFSDAGATFLVKRFDRTVDARMHYASAMTMVGATDGGGDAYDFLDVAGVIEQIGCDPKQDLQELWSRIVFHICTSNADNHLRNHGFLLTDNGWRLAPSFDVNPVNDRQTLELRIAGDERRDLRAAMEAAAYFRLNKKDATHRAKEIQRVVRDNWKKTAGKLGISAQEQKFMRPAFEEAERSL